MDFDQPPVVRVSIAREHALPPGEWPMTIPAVAQVVRDGLDLNKGVTFLVGENGSGKSTLVEAVAMAYGLSPEGVFTGATGLDPRVVVTAVAGVQAAAWNRGGAMGLLPAGRDDARLLHLPGGEPRSERSVSTR